ncbi:hypothetical protein [Marivita hallyeonensis]|uniref:Uncharacterized protein n=1 Tax=Marivita hallyeonensis TaxID=996342 RepID=A0A1M5W4W3_9RHOB|nr:hypothetical protein [Marivita hallyeonensis]SHH82526.1 hypothetical protein SAMN05443551_3259 [Marivita hallyeonensis]
MSHRTSAAAATSAHVNDLSTSKEVRAGPGDAGRQARPERLPERSGDREKGRTAIRLFAVLCAVGAAVWLILQLAG